MADPEEAPAASDPAEESGSASSAVGVTSAAILAAIAMDKAEAEAKPKTAAPPPAPAPAPAPAPVPAPAPAPAPPPPAPRAAPPTTPSRAAPAADVEIRIDEPTPQAMKFVDTVTDVSEKVSTLGSDEVRDGMYELGCRCSSNMKRTFGVFKDHALDLALAATADLPADKVRPIRCHSQCLPSPQCLTHALVALASQTRSGVIREKCEFTKLAMGPLAAWYALMTVFCMAVFAVIYYPKLYGPKLYELAKVKFVEYKMDQHAARLTEKVKSKSIEAYEVASKSEAAAKAFDAANKAYVATTTAPLAVAVAAKGGELAAKGRAKLAEKLVALRDGQSAGSSRDPPEPHTPV